MQTFDWTSRNKKIILALGAESAGNFSVYFTAPSPVRRGGLGRGCGRAEVKSMGSIYFSQDFGDLLGENNFTAFKKAVLAFLKEKKLTPNIILTDLHPSMETTLWGKTLAKKYKAQHIQIQHHHAHIFSAIGDAMCPLSCNQERAGVRFREIPNTFYGIALDGTGYGEDEKIWGGECFAISNVKFPMSNKIQSLKSKIIRMGHLENQMMIGGEAAIREPARMLIAILDKFLSKKEVFAFVKKYYTKNEFELLYNQLQNNFNCLETSSTGRILDAVSLLLGFCDNERKYKHEPIDLLEANSAKPYANLKPRINLMESSLISNNQFPISNQYPMTKFQNKYYVLDTTYLFEYLIKNLHKDKKRLAATAQLYVAEGLYEIIRKNMQSAGSSVPLEPAIKLACHPERSPYSDVVEGSTDGHHQQCHQTDSSTSLRYAQNDTVFFSGGLANNKIISAYLISKGVYALKKIPRGDAGLSFGQMVYFLFQN